ncbi:MAG: polyhydroxyalkanoate synthesis regulator DNA-binding domain-containing protein [Chloroflexota bacterium]
MHTIKKYANRKLYHINRKQYITLEGISALIQNNEPVQVTDNETGEDITAQILAQIVLQTRGQKQPLSTSFLTSLIQSSGDTFASLRRSVWSAFGGPSEVDSEIEQRLQHLQDEGTIDESEGDRLKKLLVTNGSATSKSDVSFDVPNAHDVARLNTQVDVLTQMVDQLLQEQQKKNKS